MDQSSGSCGGVSISSISYSVSECSGDSVSVCRAGRDSSSDGWVSSSSDEFNGCVIRLGAVLFGSSRSDRKNDVKGSF